MLSRGRAEALRARYRAHRDRADAMAARRQAHRPMARSQEHTAAGLDASVSSAWDSLADAFVAAHMKHNVYMELHLHALDAGEAALALSEDFVGCGADTLDMQQAWERSMRATEKADDALLEAWAALVAAGERAQ